MRAQMAQLPPFRSVVKPNDVEDPVNRYLHRTLAYLFVKSIFRTPITPNMITVFAVMIGFAAGCAFIWGTPTAMFLGGAALWAAAILDGADGILDGGADVLVAVFTVFPAFYHIWVTYHNPYHLALMVLALGLTIVHLAVYDFHKESYLRGTLPGQGGEGHDADEIAEIVEGARSKGPIVRLAIKYFLVPHLMWQKAFINWLNPDAWRLSQLLQSDDQTPEIYRDENVWPMRLWALTSLAAGSPSPRDTVATQP